MPRLARVIAVDTPHHITQRGNAHRFVLDSDPDRLVYLELLVRFSRLYRLSIVGYCLMSNHVHLIAVPHRPHSLACTLRHTQGRYAAYLNTRQATDGHAWQGRYYSCPLDTPHLWAALRYTELNPVRANLVLQPHQYRWSSAAAHCGGDWPAYLDAAPWAEVWKPSTWREYLYADGVETDAEAIRASTHTGRPLGGPEFVKGLERALGRQLAPQKGGRPAKYAAEEGQETLAFGQS